jgi:hypothetical protein
MLSHAMIGHQRVMLAVRRLATYVLQAVRLEVPRVPCQRWSVPLWRLIRVASATEVISLGGKGRRVWISA